MKQEKVIRSAGVVGSFTTLSRALGLVRDVVMAGFFGTSLSMSAFVVAFTIPNLFRRLFGEGALSAAFVPVFVETRRNVGDGAAWAVARKVITLIVLLLLCFVLAGELVISLLPDVVALSAKNLLILRLLSIMLPYMLFICLAALSMAILNSFGHFAVPAATPCVLNVVWVLATLIFLPFMHGPLESKIFVVAWAILVAGVAQLFFQYPMLRRFGYQPGLSFDFSDARVRRVLMLMGPAAVGMALTQFNVLVDRALAAWVGAWAPAALYFSERLIYFPLGICGTALGTVLLPVFSRHAADGQFLTINSTINQSLRTLLFLMIPSAVGLGLLAQPIIESIYQWREFTAESTWFTAVALQCYAPGLIVFSLSKVFVPAFFALQDTRTPVRVGMATVLLNLLANLIFILTLPVRYKHAGIALATVLAETGYAVALAWILQRRIGSPGWPRIFRSLGKVLLISGLMGVVVWFGARWIPEWLATMGSLSEKFRQIATVGGSILIAVPVYLLLALVVRCEELQFLLAAMRRRAK
ncbi:MAG: murein biosynthesis integral membrane protein MurJ [Kiritimatiellae bacterium]|nr:murein biosynthesis integral membrane protein MurJ [Kiritimatiellia bacterium]